MYKLSLHVEYKILSELFDLEDDKIYQERCDGILKLETVEFWPILSQISCIHSVKLDLYVIESNHAVGVLKIWNSTQNCHVPTPTSKSTKSPILDQGNVQRLKAGSGGGTGWVQ